MLFRGTLQNQSISDRCPSVVMVPSKILPCSRLSWVGVSIEMAPLHVSRFVSSCDQLGNVQTKDYFIKKKLWKGFVSEPRTGSIGFGRRVALAFLRPPQWVSAGEHEQTPRGIGFGRKLRRAGSKNKSRRAPYHPRSYDPLHNRSNSQLWSRG